MNERIKDKLDEIEEYLSILMSIIPSDIEEYKSSYQKKWSCEKGFENIIETVTDIAHLIIRQKKLEVAKEDTNSFDILEKECIISKELCQKLKEARGMRNILTHEYGKVDDILVFDSLRNELEQDINKFIETIRKWLKEDIS